jgi:hypothetical protein
VPFAQSDPVQAVVAPPASPPLAANDRDFRASKGIGPTGLADMVKRF